MAEWQYTPNDNVHVPIDKGYYQTTPAVKADRGNATGYLEDPDGQQMYLWLHQIESGFQVGGQFAQSVNKADWLPRNFIQPKFKVTGQVANQQEYAKLAEFIRVNQQKALRWQRPDKVSNATKLVIWSSKSPSYNTQAKTRQHQSHGYTSYVLFGHILNAERRATRFVNSPEYSFDFQISYAYHGLFRQDRAADASLQRLAPWMDIFKNGLGQLQEDPDVYFLQDRPELTPGANGELRPT